MAHGGKALLLEPSFLRKPTNRASFPNEQKQNPRTTGGACELGSAKTLPARGGSLPRRAKQNPNRPPSRAAAGTAEAASLRSSSPERGSVGISESAEFVAGFRGAGPSRFGRDDGGVRGEEEGAGAGGGQPLRLLPLRPRCQEPQIGELVSCLCLFLGFY